jgi:hypothetical protein
LRSRTHPLQVNKKIVTTTENTLLNSQEKTNFLGQHVNRF